MSLRRQLLYKAMMLAAALLVFAAERLREAAVV